MHDPTLPVAENIPVTVFVSSASNNGLVPTSWTGLAVALLAIAPGFIATAAWARARTWKGSSGDLRTILQSLVLSAVVQVLVLPLTIAWVLPDRADPDRHAWPLAGWAVLSVLVLPIVLGYGVGWLQDWVFPPTLPWDETPSGWRRALARVLKPPVPPSTWDWVFTRRNVDGRFLLVEFDDGSHVGGVFGLGSLALTSPDPQGLFLASEWELNANADFVSPIPGTQGILIPTTSNVRWVRVLGSEDALSEPPDAGDEGSGNG